MTEIPPLTTRADVAALLQVELKSLTWWVWALNEEKRYAEFDLLRRNGTLRRISAPIKPIKDLQRRLADLLSAWYQPPAQVHGFVKHRAIHTNAAPHRAQEWVFRADLSDFFPSINFGRVRGMFMAYPFDFSEEAATLLAQLCCHRNVLAQGAPTSPALSNFICRGMDKELAKLARSERCFFTRYADDLTFSTDRRAFPASIAQIEPDGVAIGDGLLGIVSSHGFGVNSHKTTLSPRWQRQRVTGLVVNERLNLPREYRRDLRNVLYIWERHGLEAAKASYGRKHQRVNWPPGKSPPRFQAVIRGKVQYVGSVRGYGDRSYRALATALHRCDPSFTIAPLAEDVCYLYVCVEGQTDVTHLKSAIRHFHAKNEFTDLVLDFDERSDFGSDTRLAKYLRSLPASRPSVPTVCFFDRDNQQLLKDEGLATVSYVDKGNGVVAATVVTPKFRVDPVCIEMLFSDEDLQRKDADGRRVYLISEFDERTRHHRSEACSLSEPKRTLVRDDVFQFTTGRSLALSKDSFAAAVASGDPPFDSVSFEGFRPTLEMLREAAKAVKHKVR